jgi:hypothetical protein
MRRYLELVELVEEEGDFIRIDVTEWNWEDIEEAISLLKEHAKAYDSYVIYLHDCYHDEGKSCSTIMIESRW